MSREILKTAVGLLLMIGFLVMAFLSKDVAYSKILTSLGILTGSFIFRFLSTHNTTTHEKH